MRHLESQLQCALVEWARWNTNKYPELALFHAIPNGGKRNKIEGGRLKREGVLAGVPDLFLPAARKGFHGLYLETKSESGKLTKEQERIILLLEWQGFVTKVYRSLDEGIKVLEWWLR